MLHLAVTTLRRSLGIVLSLWIAGVGCIVGCQNMTSAAAAVHDGSPVEHGLAAVVSGNACAQSASHDCCAKKETKAQTKRKNAHLSLKLATQLSQSESLNQGPSSGVRECPLALSRALAITKATDSKHLADSLSVAVIALRATESREQHTALSPLARLPNRGHTYLRCCVFLI